MRRSHLALITLILLMAAGLRFASLTRLPPGFNNDEIANIDIAETVRTGKIASLYNVNNQGYEGLYPVLESAVTALIGNGLLCYRILSTWCGLLSIALAYALTKRLFGKFAGLTGALTLALTLWPIILARSAIRETLLLPLVFLLLLVLARALHLDHDIEPGAPTTPAYATVGVLIALLAYTHWTGLVGLPLVMAFIAYLILTHQPISRRVMGFSGFAILLALIVAIPYVIVSIRRFSLSGIQMFWTNRPDSIGGFINEILQTVLSIGIRGDPSAQHNLSGSALLGPLGLILLIAGIIVAVRRWRSPNMMLMLLVLGFGLAPATWSHTEPDFARMVIAMPALVGLVGLGTAALGSAILKFKQPDLMLQSLPVMLAVGVTAIIAMGFTYILLQRWGDSPEVNQAYHGGLGHLAVYLDHTHDDLTTSICTLNLEQNNQNRISDPDLMGLMLNNKNQNLRFSDCMNALVLTKGGERQRIAFASPDAEQSISPILNDWLKTGQPVAVPGLPPGAVQEIDVHQALADIGGQFATAPVSFAPETSGPSSNAVLPIRMGYNLTFKGYQLMPDSEYKLGDTLNVVSFWRSDNTDGPQAPDLRIFVHLLTDPNDKPLLQNDDLSVSTDLLQDRDVFIEVSPIQFPLEFPTGDYYISVGAYHMTTQQRLPVYDQDQERGNRLFLRTIKVDEASK